MSAARYGLFGGSFDPPHRAHVALARLARDHLQLDALFVVPAGDPWQKAHRTLQPAEHRLAMTALAFGGEARIAVDPIELQRQGPSYTLDTVRALQARQPGEWFLVIGQDQYARIDTWHGWAELLPRVTLAVAARAGRLPEPPAALQGIAHRSIVLPLPALPLSSSDVRMRLARREDVSTLVPPAVAGYIAQHHLYEKH